MFRIITSRRLEQLQADLNTARRTLLEVHTEHAKDFAELGFAREQIAYFKKLAEQWERRACRFIDQVGIKSDTISAPAMSEPVPPPQSGSRQVMTALAIGEINKGKPPVSQAPQVDGVNEDVAREAVAFVRK